MKAGLKTRLEPKDPIGSIGKYGLVCRASNRLYIKSLSPIFSLTLWKALERRSRLRNIFTREPEDGKSLGRSLSLFWSQLSSINRLTQSASIFLCRLSSEGMVAATSTAVDMSSSSAAPTAANAAPRSSLSHFMWLYICMLLYVCML